MSRLIPTQWKYFGNTVYLARSAQIAPPFRHNGPLNKVIPDVLSYIEPWEGDGCRANHPVRRVLKNEVAQRRSDTPPVIWGIHIGHKAEHPEPSPFVELPRPPVTRHFTLVLKGTPEEPIVVQGYPAPAHSPYVPPLPWQRSAEDANGGVRACERFWHRHAYVLWTPKLIREGSRQTQPPDWW